MRSRARSPRRSSRPRSRSRPGRRPPRSSPSGRGRRPRSPSAGSGRRAPRRRRAPLRLPSRLLDPVEDPLLRVGVDHGADVGLLVGGVADLERLDARQHPLDEARRRPRARRRSAARRCSSVRRRRSCWRRSPRRPRRGRRRPSTITGRRVAELEADLLLRRALLQAPADGARAGERDRLHALVLDQHVADLGGRARRRRSASRAAAPPPPRAPRAAAPRVASGSRA